jgi:hypothetical protein
MSPGNGYKLAVRIPILVQGIEEILHWICTGSIEHREMRTLHTAFECCLEAAEGMLRVYALRTSRQFTADVQTDNGGMVAKKFTASVWEPIDWMRRMEEIFGVRVVPAPSLQVGVAPATPMLSQGMPSATNGEAQAPIPPSEPASDDTPESTAPTVNPFAGMASKKKEGGSPF